MPPKNKVNYEFCVVRGRATNSIYCTYIYIKLSFDYCDNFKNFSHEQLH